MYVFLVHVIFIFLFFYSFLLLTSFRAMWIYHDHIFAFAFSLLHQIPYRHGRRTHGLEREYGWGLYVTSWDQWGFPCMREADMSSEQETRESLDSDVNIICKSLRCYASTMTHV